MDVKSDIRIPVLPGGPPTVPVPAASVREDKASAAPLKDAAKDAPDDREARKIVREALKLTPLPDRELRIEVESDLNLVVVKVVDKESGEVVRQIPFEETVASARRIKERLDRMAHEKRGLAVDREV